MVAEVFASIGAFKTMFDLAKGLKDINDAAIRNSAVIELQEQILSAQAAQAALIERVCELETQVASFEKWETEKEKYERRKLVAGNIVFTLKEESSLSEPSHALCANCFEAGHKSYLQAETRVPGMCRVLACPRCGSDIYTAGQRHPEHHQTPRKR